jgi:hypothetical protein
VPDIGEQGLHPRAVSVEIPAQKGGSVIDGRYPIFIIGLIHYEGRPDLAIILDAMGPPGGVQAEAHNRKKQGGKDKENCHDD